jgi:hypothetical protein
MWLDEIDLRDFFVLPPILLALPAMNFSDYFPY